MIARITYTLMVLLLLGGCQSMQIEDFKDTEPKFVLEQYFEGKTKAWGIFEDRFGNLRREFVVDIDGTWDGTTLTLDERFDYADGEKDRRIWTIEKAEDGRYVGRADDVIGSGYANADFDNVLSATTTATLLAANEPIDFSTLASVFVGGTLGIASHPSGLLHVNGFYDASFTANYTSIDLIEVDALFSAQTPEPVVTFVDTCTAFGKAEALSDGSILLGITVGDSSRLVHVGRE